jgi:hypothetical protein
MGNDSFIRHSIDFPKGDKKCHEWVVHNEQYWRLLDGAEPSPILSIGAPAIHMRYGPYQ